MPNDRHARLGDAQGAEHELHDRPRVEHGGGERAARAEHGGGDAKALGAERAREARAPHAAEVDDEEVDPGGRVERGEARRLQFPRLRVAVDAHDGPSAPVRPWRAEVHPVAC